LLQDGEMEQGTSDAEARARFHEVSERQVPLLEHVRKIGLCGMFFHVCSLQVKLQG